MANEPIRDMDTFVKKWSPRVRSTLRRFGIRNNDLLNDLEQEIYFRMITNRTLEVYDPAKSQFSTHIYQVIRTIALNYKRASTRDPVSCGEPLMMHGEGDDEFLHPEVAKNLTTEDKEGKPVDEFMERLYKELGKVPSWSSGSKHGRSVKSLTVVCRLIQQGYKPKEIAKVFNVGESSVSAWMERIRQIAYDLKAREGM